MPDTEIPSVEPTRLASVPPIGGFDGQCLSTDRRRVDAVHKKPVRVIRPRVFENLGGVLLACAVIHAHSNQ